MATAIYTGNADQLFRTISQIQARMKELQKLKTDFQFRAQLDAGSMRAVGAQAKEQAKAYSQTTIIAVQAKVTGMAEQARKMREYYAKGIAAKILPYITNASLKAVKDRIKGSVSGGYAEVGLRFQTGAAGKFRDTLKRMLAVLSRASFIDAELRPRGVAGVLNGLKNKKVLIDVDVKVGTAAKIKALLELLKKLREGVKIPVKLDIDPGLQPLLKSLVRDLKAAADAAARLDRRLGGAAAGAGNLGRAAAGVPGTLARIRDGIVAFASSIVLVQGLQAAFNGLKAALISYPALLESAQVGLERMMGSAEKGKEMMDAIREFAIPTPFEVENLLPKAHQALAFGLVDPESKNAAKETIALLRDIGDAAFGLGRGQEGVDRIMLAFGQMHTAQKVNAQDLLQLQQVGINAWTYLSQATGKTTGEVRKLVTAGLIPADKAIAAIRVGLQKKFGGGMEAASKTLIGAAAQLKDASKDKLKSFFEPQFRALSDFSVKAAKVLSSREFDRWILAFAGKVEQVFGFAIGVYDGFVEQIRQGNPLLLGVLAVLGARFVWLANVAIGKAMFSAGVSIGRFAASILALPAPLLIAIAAAAAFGLAYKKNFLGVASITDAVVSGVVDGVKTLAWALGSIVEGTSKLLQKIPDSVLAVVNPLGLGLKKMLGDQTGLADGLLKDFDDFDARAAKWRTNLEDTFNIDSLGREVKGLIGGLLPDISGALAEKGAKVAVAKPAEMPHIDTPDGSAAKARAAALKLQKDALADSARAYDAQAKAVENQARAVEASAKAQIEALTGVRDTIRDVFGSIQDEFVRLGIIDDPLGPMLRGFERLIDLGGQSEKIAAKARGQFDNLMANGQKLRGQGNAARSRNERLSGLDGQVPGASGGPNFSGGNARSLFEHFNLKSQVDMTCADVASRTVEALGIAVKKSVNAGQLERNVKAANWKRVDPRSAPQGALVFKDSRSARSGVHAMMSLGDGQLASSSGHKTSYFRARGTERAYAPGGSATGRAMIGLGAANVQSESAAFGLTGIDGTLTKIAAVNKAWGAAVKSTEGNTARFALQTKLATREFQDALEVAAQKSGQTVPQIIARLRGLANAADSKINRARAVDAVSESLADLRKQMRAVAAENNPLAGVLAEFEAGGKFAGAPGQKTAVLDAQMRLSLAQTTQATKEAVKAESLKTAALKAAAPFLSAATAGTGSYARALETATRRVSLWQDAQIQGNLLAAASFDKMGGAALRAAAALRANPFVAAPGMAAHLEATGQGLKGRAAGIRTAQSATVNLRDGAVQVSTDADRRAAREKDGFEADFAAKQDGYLAESERRILRDERLNEREKQLVAARLEWIHNKDLELRKGGNYTDAKNLTDTLATRGEAERQAGGIDFGKQFKDDDAKAFTSSADEAARAVATFGDLTGLAAAKYDQAHGALSTLTQTEREQMLVQQAAIAGLQKYGQEFDSLFGQKFVLAQSITERQMGLTRGLSELEKQELQWKFQDAEATERMADATKDQRDAYNALKPKIDAARNSIRALLKQEEPLKAKEWLKGSQRNFSLMMEQDEVRRARTELKNQLRDQGFTDSVVIKAILNVNEMQLRAGQTLERMRDYVSSVQGIMSQGFDAAFERGPAGFFESVLGGFADMISNVSKQILSAALTKLFVSAFPQVGGVFDEATQSATNLTSATVASAFSATGAAVAYTAATAALIAYTAAAIAFQAVTGTVASVAGGATAAAIGENYVPYDGAMYRLHRGESVLTRRETEQRAAIAASPGGSGGSRGAAGFGGGNVHIENLNLPEVREPKQFAPALDRAVAPKLSRRSQQNLAYDRVTPGGRQR